MAAAKVFNVPELLEMILEGVPPSRLFLANAVSKSWKSAIDSSIKLQRILCLVPLGSVTQPVDEDPGELFSDYALQDVPILDAQSSKSLAELFDFGHTAIGSSLPVWQGFKVPHTGSGPDSDHRYMFQFAEMICDTGTRILLPRVCRSMYMCQPPVAAALLRIVRWEDGPEILVVVYDREGVTLGLVADTFARVLKGMTKPRWISKTMMLEDGFFPTQSKESWVHAPWMGIEFVSKVADEVFHDTPRVLNNSQSEGGESEGGESGGGQDNDPPEKDVQSENGESEDR